jgi:hypothetical protein
VPTDFNLQQLIDLLNFVSKVLILNIYAAAIYLTLLSDILMNGEIERLHHLTDGMSSRSEMKPLETYIQEARGYLYLEE